MKISIGKHESRNVSFDLDVLLTTRLLIQANSGAGKSWLLRKLMEELFGHVQVIAIDPEGEFATLREKFDYALVGKGGEIPADVRIAGDVAEKLLELRLSAVCDLYELRMADRHQWVAKFLDALVNAPKRLWHPLIVVVDEAHMFCPEKGAGESAASGPMIDLCTRGRKRGFCAVWATQRLSKVQKDATTNLLNRLVGGTFEDVDIKRALDLLSVAPEDKREFAQSLKTLEPGWFYAFGRAVTKERVLFKVGQVQTSHPQPGSAKHAAEPPPPPEKIKAVLAKLAEIPHAAEEKARTVSDYQRQVRELKSELAAAKRAAPTVPQVAPVNAAKLQADIERQVRLGLKERDTAWLRAVRDFQRELDRRTTDVTATITKLLRAVPFTPPEVAEVNVQVERTAPPRVSQVSQVSHVSTPPAREPRAPREAENNGDLPKGERAVLAALAQYPEGVERPTLTTLTGYKRSTRDTYLQRLGERGYVTQAGGRLAATQEGIAALGDFEPLPVGDDLLRHWLQRLPEGERKVLEFLAAHPGEGVDREAISETTGYARSSRDTYLQRLRARQLVESVGSKVKAAEILFG